MVMQYHLFNCEEYARRIKSGKIDVKKYYEQQDSVEFRKLNEIITNLLNEKTEKILDVGCSLGFYSFGLAKLRYFVVGLDYEINSLMIARTESSKIQEHNCPRFINADAIKLPFKTGSFDKIVNVDFIEHIVLEKQEQVIKELHRILSDSGRIYVYTPNYVRVRMEYFINKIKYLLKGRCYGWQEDRPYVDNPELRNHQDTLLHVGLLSFEELKKLFVNSGFEVDKIIYNFDEYSVPFVSGIVKKIMNKFRILSPPFYGIFCCNNAFIFKKQPVN